MSCDKYFEALIAVGDFRGQTLEQVLGRVWFGTPLVIKGKSGEVIFDRTWPYYANPPAVVGRDHMGRLVLRVTANNERMLIEVI